MSTIEQRFWSKVAIGGPDDCWEWQRSRNDSGYGQFRVSVDQSPQKASRVAWALTHGDPGSLCVLHRCDNPPCCNPAHLFLGTVADNNADKAAKGRQARAGHEKYTDLVEGVRRLTNEEIRQAREDHAAGASCRSIARRLGVAHTTVSRLINGTHWKDFDI